MKTTIHCSVNSCKFYKDEKCHAKEISICCDNVLCPCECSQTACKSFQCK